MSMLDQRVDEALRPKDVDAHAGHHRDLLDRHRAAAFQAASQGPRTIREFSADLFPRVHDTRTLRAALDSLEQRGGQAPGPNGLVLRDLCNSEKWELARLLSRQLRDGQYRHGPDRVVHVPKASGRGKRELTIENIEDRVVGRALVEIVQPVLDPTFDAHSFCRPRRGPWHALVRAEQLFAEGGRPIWIAEDIRDAFAHVPLRRLLDVLRHRLPADDLLDLVARVVDNGTAKGLRQGSCFSPVLMNLYLDHFLDRPWRRQSPDVPLLRYMDDLLVMCREEDDPQAIYAGLQRLLRDAAMPLKGTPQDSIHDLRRGDEVNWLGYRLSCSADVLVVRADLDGEPGGLLERLRDALALAHSYPDAPLRAIQVIQGMLGHAGPCFPHMDRKEVYQRVLGVAREMAFEEIGTQKEFVARWRRAHAKWQALRDGALQQPQDDHAHAQRPTRRPKGNARNDMAPF